MDTDKKAVHDFWESASCGESLYLKEQTKEYYLKQSEIRYNLEPFIADFADFQRYDKEKVLEIGIGLGADHHNFAKAGAILYGIDLTERAVCHTRKRFELFSLSSELIVHDAEELPFDDEKFDLVYSWGVLHHTPDTKKSVDEVLRVLKPDGEAKIMIYHKYSFVGYMLWLRYALLRLKPLTSLKKIYSQYLESPGTKAYSIREAEKLFRNFKDVEIKTVLTHGDLLTSQAGQRHKGLLLSIARLLWQGGLSKPSSPDTVCSC